MERGLPENIPGKSERDETRNSTPRHNQRNQHPFSLASSISPSVAQALTRGRKRAQVNQWPFSRRATCRSLVAFECTKRSWAIGRLKNQTHSIAISRRTERAHLLLTSIEQYKLLGRHRAVWPSLPGQENHADT